MNREEIIHTLKKRGINVGIETGAFIVLMDGSTLVALIEKHERTVSLSEDHTFSARELMLIAELAEGKGVDHGDGFI